MSIVQVQEGVVEVLASHGDTQLGGDDFDDLLLQHVCERFEQEHGVDLRANLIAKARVLRAVEAAKRHLSEHPFARIEEEFIAEKQGRALHLNLEIDAPAVIYVCLSAVCKLPFQLELSQALPAAVLPRHRSRDGFVEKGAVEVTRDCEQPLMCRYLRDPGSLGQRRFGYSHSRSLQRLGCRGT